MKKTILITGGAGFIGSHAVVAFEQAGYQTVILDNFANSSRRNLDGIHKILGYSPDFYECDICDREGLTSIFEKYSFDGVIHFAGLKAVGESCQKPFHYHANNIGGSMILFSVMEAYGVRRIVFSSSATVYAPTNISPLSEDMPLGTTNPYGTTKLILEKTLQDYAGNANWSVVSLRYFNPIGAHSSGYIGEMPSGVPNNLLPYLMDVATGSRESVTVFGDDYDTIDGTGVRDYIDVCDLVDAHLLTYGSLSSSGFGVYNIGTGKGTSVLEMIDIVKRITKRDIPHRVSSRRSGDIACVYCDPSRANIIGFIAHTSLEESVMKSWKFIGGGK